MLFTELSREKTRVLRSLASGKMRGKRGLCIVEGQRALAEAKRSGRLRYLVTAARGDSGPSPPPPLETLGGVPVYSVHEDLFEELSDVGSGIGLIGAAETPPPSCIEEMTGAGGGMKLFLLDGVQDPGNVGTLIRTAWALGLAGVLLGAGTADPFGPRAVRASAGAVFHLPLVPGVGPREVDVLLGKGFTLLYAERGGEDFRGAVYPGKCVLALGNEGAGLSAWVTERGNAVGIPMARGADSLNVVVAGAIIAASMIGHGDTETR